MCGICGIVSPGPAPDLELLRAMLGRLRHRGPDGTGWYRDHRAALGHTRLSIIDVAGGGQPLSNEDGTIWVTFNGEIFNYVELRDELRRLGHEFRTASDTEVIVHAWEQWQEACFERFNGQWALALWERLTGRLILSRDRLGVRPLFYARRGGGLVFASEVKAIFADPSVHRAFDPEGIDQTLTYWSTIAPRTVYEGVEQLEPGHFAVLDDHGFRTAPYWEPSFPVRGQEQLGDLATAAEQLRERLVEAVRLRFLRSDVPVAAYLSGGIDSSVTAALMSRYTDVPLHTFSLRFADPEYDEGFFQQQMASQLGAEHHDVRVSGSDIAAVFPEVVWHTETPVLRAAPAPLFLLSRLVQENGFKVVVTGEGADEVLAGYDIFREARVRLFWSRDPGSTVRTRAAELLYPWMARSPGQAPAFARTFFGRNLDSDDPAISHRPRWDSTSALKSMLTEEWRSQLSGSDEWALAMPSASSSWDPLARAQWLEMTTLLPGYILSSQGDRMLMGNSVEGRFPFLDRDVVQLANGLPAGHKLFGLEEKYVLKRVAADLVPDSITRRPKQPYRAPDAASFFFGDRPPSWVEEVTSSDAIAECGLFDARQVERLLAKCARTGGRSMGNTDNMRVLAVLSAQLTYYQFITGSGAPSDAPPVEPTIEVDMLETEEGIR